MPRVLYTYPHISRGTSATFNSKDPKNDYPTTDEIICRAKNVGPSSIETFTLGARGDVLTRYIASTLQVLGLKN